jgi:pilus assembly protein CpaC
MKRKQKVIHLTLWLGLISGAFILNPAHAAPAPVTNVTGVKMLNVQVPLNKSRLVRINSSIETISQSNERIAGLTVFTPNQILVQGNSLGTTNIYIWNKGDQLMQIVNVEVTHDLETLKLKLHELLPGEKIEVRSSQRNIILSGQVSSLDKMQAAVDIAQSFLPPSNRSGQVLPTTQAPASPSPGQGGTSINVSSGNQNQSQRQGLQVINLLSVSGAQQVMLEVKVAEIDRTLARQLDVQFAALHPSNNFSFGALNGGGTIFPLNNILAPNPHSINAAGLFLSAVSGDFIFNLTVDAAKDQDLAKILAEPTLTTLSGQEAKFISGGEFPIPVAQATTGGTGSITVEFKEFGISLKCLPVVLDSGRINLNMNVSVSELSQDAAVVSDIAGTDLKFSIPSLTKREASSTLELADGQTMSIAGLISDSLRENINKFPGLGDLPVLGTLFRSSKFLKKQTELVIFVTPKLAKSVLQSQIRLPTDSFVEPGDRDFYIFGSMENLKTVPPVASNSGGLDGQFGHALIEDSQ